MNKNYIVSFPRSGHHGLMGFLDITCGLGRDYCEFYTCKNYDGSDIECCMAEKGWSQKGYECHAGKTNIKCHDFDLGLPYGGASKYLVQVRHPFLSIQSWYQMESGKGKELPDWQVFFEQQLQFWQRFVNKWVVDLGSKPNVYVLRYDDIGNVNVLREVAEFLGYANKFDMGALPENYFHSKRSIGSDKFLEFKESQIQGLLEKTGINKIF